MKKQYFPTVVGFRGVLKQVKRMGTKAQEFFKQREAKLDEDDSFQIGDSSALPENGQFDTIYCINGYGYSPLTDPGIFSPMAKTLKKGGELVIISEVMGPRAEPFLKFSRQDRKSLEGLFVMTRKEDVITENPDPRATMNIITKEFVRHVLSDNEPLARAFALTETNPQTVAAEEFFKPDLSASTIYLDKSSALGWDPLTTTMQSRHTEGGGELDENIHVRLVFRKK